MKGYAFTNGTLDGSPSQIKSVETPDSCYSVERFYKPIDLKKHEELLEEDEEEEDGYSSQLRQELLYNVSGLKGKTTISPIEFTGFIAWLLLTIAVMMFTLWAWAPYELFDRHFKHIPLFPS